MGNRLQDSTSPYLEQHQEDPTDWWPYGDEALVEAKRLNKPILLSIGYATCHWCHVMHHESFQDREVAQVLNRVAIPIKVDREQRPDVDATYMAACQAMTGRGGWPLTILATPEGVPFFAGTYLPKRSRGRQMGFVELLERVETMWKEDPKNLQHQAQHLLDHLQSRNTTSAQDLDGTEVSTSVLSLWKGHDREHAGFGKAPKFPQWWRYLFLLAEADRPQIQAIVQDLQRILGSGLMDHMGGGVHRYATDREWHVPHFEKMLYDQAGLLLTLTEAHRRSPEPFLAAAAEHLVTYVLRDLLLPTGGFATGEDADSEGEEGTFYVWDYAQLQARLGKDLTQALGAKPRGNWHDEATGHAMPSNHLDPQGNWQAVAKALGVPYGEAAGTLWETLAPWIAERAKRPRPLRDDKVLTDQNAQMIMALLRAGDHFRKPQWKTIALRELDGLLDAWGPQGVRHARRGARWEPLATLDDTASLGWACFEAWQTTGEKVWRERSLEAYEDLVERFGPVSEGLRMTEGAILMAHRDAYDGAQPSGLSLAAQLAARLERVGAITEGSTHELLKPQGQSIRTHPQAYTSCLDAWQMAELGRDIAFRGQQWPQRLALIRGHRDVLLDIGDGEAPDWFATAEGEFVQICTGKTCGLPVRDAQALQQALTN